MYLITVFIHLILISKYVTLNISTIKSTIGINTDKVFTKSRKGNDMDFENSIIKDYVEKALKKLYAQDSYLIVNHPSGNQQDCHVSERGIVFRFGIYFQELISTTPLNEFNLDVEYNRNMYEKKMLPSFSNGTFPDLILHKRGSNDHNILILEFKTWWNHDTTDDEKKISQFMDVNGKYRYKMGASIILGKNEYDIKWIN